MLIDADEDDAEVLAAEDAAIRLAADPPPEPTIPLGDDLAALIARVTNGPPSSDTTTG